LNSFDIGTVEVFTWYMYLEKNVKLVM
jgi:hypothetical protein